MSAIYQRIIASLWFRLWFTKKRKQNKYALRYLSLIFASCLFQIIVYITIPAIHFLVFVFVLCGQHKRSVEHSSIPLYLPPLGTAFIIIYTCSLPQLLYEKCDHAADYNIIQVRRQIQILHGNKLFWLNMFAVKTNQNKLPALQSAYDNYCFTLY